MRSRDLHSLMWGEALSLLEQAERLQRQFFRVGSSAAARTWEPPVDLVESGDASLRLASARKVAKRKTIIISQ